MGKTRKSDDGGYWEDHAAIVPLRFDFVPMGTGVHGSDVVVKAERPILMEDADAVELRRFYEAQLEIPQLAPGIRNAVMKELGRSQRAENVKVEHARTVTLRHVVDETAARMRAREERPRGGVRQGAITAVADSIGIDAETLKLRFKRLKRRGRGS
jgi:hypothetical protein